MQAVAGWTSGSVQVSRAGGFDKFYANMARGREVLLVREPTALELHYGMSVIHSTVTAALSCCALRPGGQLIYSG